MGINNAVTKYNVDAHIFQDAKFVNITNRYPNIKTVAPAWYGDMIQKKNRELVGSYPYKFKENNENEIFLNNRLAWCGFTHDYAISYCIMKGYKNIVLIGAADFIGKKHFLTEEEFKYSEKLKFQSKKFIEEICTKKANIYTCNPDSILEIPRVTVEELLNTDFGN